MTHNDPRNPGFPSSANSKINLEEFARSKIAEVIRRRILERTNYSEPDDTCSCDDFVTLPPNAPTRPRRRQPPLPPSPPRPPTLPPPLPPPPVRYAAPQLPSVIPPFLAPPPIIFPSPDIEEDGGEGVTGATGDVTTEPPGTTTISEPPSGGGPEDGLWEGRIPCCGKSRTNSNFASDTELSLAAEESTHSGEFRNGCYPACGTIRELPNPPGGVGFCQREGLQICQCIARNNSSNPCYEGNGQISPPGANLTTSSILKKEVLPNQYNSPSEYYADRLVST